MRESIRARHSQWTITADTITTESSGETGSTYTQKRAPYVRQDGFRFAIYRKVFASMLPLQQLSEDRLLG